MDKNRLNTIMKEALRLKAQGLEEEAQAVAKIAKAYRNGEEMGVVQAALVGIADGVTASWGDEIASGVYAVAQGLTGENVKESYGRMAKKLRGYQQEAELTSPYAKGAGEVVGAIGSMAVGPAWFQAGEKGVEAIQAMKAAKGLKDYAGATARAVHVFGKPAAGFGALTGAGRAKSISEIPKSALEGAVGGYVVGGLVGTTVGNIFYKSPIPGKGPLNTKAQTLNRARADFGDEFVKDNEDTILEFHELIKKHGFKGKDVEEALKEAEATGKDLNTKLTNFMKAYSRMKKGIEEKGYVPGQRMVHSNIPPIGERGDPTEITARELLEGFEGSLKSINKKTINHDDEYKKLYNLVTKMRDDPENNSIRTLSRQDARFKRTGVEPDRVYGTEPMEPTGKTGYMESETVKPGTDIYGTKGDPSKGEWIEYKTQSKPFDPITGEAEVKAETVRKWVPYGEKGKIGEESVKSHTYGSKPIEEDILDSKVFNVEGQRALLDHINSLIEEGDRYKIDKDVIQKFAAHVRNKYQGNLDYLDETGAMQHGMDWGIEPGTPKKYHEIIKLRDAFEKGASKKLNEEAEREAIKKTPLIAKGINLARTWTLGAPGKTKEAMKAAEEYFKRSKPPTGLLEITAEDMANMGNVPPEVAKSMAEKFKPKPVIEHPFTRGKIGETTVNTMFPAVNPTIPSQQQQEDEETKERYQHQKDQNQLEKTRMFRQTAPTEGDLMNETHTSINAPKTDKLMAAIRKARNNGEIISTNDPDFKRKIRKYLLDSDLDYA